MNILSAVRCDQKTFRMNHRAVKINRQYRTITNLALPLPKQLIRTGLRSMLINLMEGIFKRSLAPSFCCIVEYKVMPIWKLLLLLRFKKAHLLLMLYKECHNRKAKKEITVSIHPILYKPLNFGILLNTLLSSHFLIKVSTQGELTHRWRRGGRGISIIFYRRQK